jgi:hypothetical protein
MAELGILARANLREAPRNGLASRIGRTSTLRDRLMSFVKMDEP